MKILFCIFLLCLSLRFSVGNTIYLPQQGTLKGFTENNKCYTYIGIPFAKPPIGNLRFEAPVTPNSWNGIFSATSYGYDCVQNPAGFTGEQPVTMNVSENCLNLNIRRPKNSKINLPVIIYIHGGNFQTGSGRLVPTCDLADELEAVIVTPNYRLNIFGFGAFNDSPANVGFLDQIMVFHWVRLNIAAFGGNPHSVTLMGHSAGATSVLTHLVMTPSYGLFDRVFSLSPSWSLKTLNDVQAKSLSLLNTFHCTDVTCMKNVDASQLYGAASGLDIGAYSDRNLVPTLPILNMKNGNFYKVPVVQGHQTFEANSLTAGVLKLLGVTPLDVNEFIYNLVLSFFFPEPFLTAVKNTYQPQIANIGYFLTLSSIAHDLWYECAMDKTASYLSQGSASYRYYFVHGPDYQDPIAPFYYNATHETILGFVFGKDAMKLAIMEKLSSREKKLRRELIDSIDCFIRENTPYCPQSDKIKWLPYTQPSSSSEKQRTIIDINAGHTETSYNQRPYCSFWESLYIG